MTAPLLVGVARGSGANTALSSAGVISAKHERFCQELSRGLELEVRPLQAKSYTELSEAVEQGKVALAWLPPIIANKLSSASRALPVAIPVRAGSSTFSTALFGHPEGPSRLEDLSGVRVAWVERFSASGYAVIRAALRARGYSLEKMFGSEIFAGSHQAVVRAVQNGQADVGATYFHRDPAGRVVNPGWADANIRVLCEYGPVPADVLAAGTQLPSQLIQQIQRQLVEASSPSIRRAACKLFEADAFVRADPAHLSALSPLLAHFDPGSWGGRTSIPPGR